MPLSVIGAGYPRTGTSTLKAALEQLGFGPCYHMRELFMNPDHAALWVQAKEGKADWEAIFKGYRSTTDAPGCQFWRELMDVYPSAKILLSVRDPEQWFESTQATVFSPAMTGRLDKTPLKDFFQKIVYEDFGARIHDRDFMLGQFKRHTDEVIAAVPKERLLVFDVREGWKPLCAFLGVAAPDTPFPRTNTREEMAAMGIRPETARDLPTDLDQIRQMARERFSKSQGGK